MEVGIDIVEIERIRRLDNGRYTLKSIYTSRELQQMEVLKNVKKVYRMAENFAAKEAVVKALGTGFDQGIRITDIEVLRDDSEKPYIVLYNKANDLVVEMGIKNCSIAISHCKKYAVAFVVLEGGEAK